MVFGLLVLVVEILCEVVVWFAGTEDLEVVPLRRVGVEGAMEVNEGEKLGKSDYDDKRSFGKSVEAMTQKVLRYC